MIEDFTGTNLLAKYVFLCVLFGCWLRLYRLALVILYSLLRTLDFTSQNFLTIQSICEWTTTASKHLHHLIIMIPKFSNCPTIPKWKVELMAFQDHQNYCNSWNESRAPSSWSWLVVGCDLWTMIQEIVHWTFLRKRKRDI